MTWHSSRHSVITEHSNTQSYGSFSIRNKTAFSWNFLKSKLNMDITSASHNKAKKMLNLYFINFILAYNYSKQSSNKFLWMSRKQTLKLLNSGEVLACQYVWKSSELSFFPLLFSFFVIVIIIINTIIIIIYYQHHWCCCNCY